MNVLQQRSPRPWPPSWTAMQSSLSTGREVNVVTLLPGKDNKVGFFGTTMREGIAPWVIDIQDFQAPKTNVSQQALHLGLGIDPIHNVSSRAASHRYVQPERIIFGCFRPVFDSLILGDPPSPVLEVSSKSIFEVLCVVQIYESLKIYIIQEKIPSVRQASSHILEKGNHELGQKSRADVSRYRKINFPLDRTQSGIGGIRDIAFHIPVSVFF